MKVLVIDDDPDILVFWKNTLKSLNAPAPISALSGDDLKSKTIDYDDIKFAIVDFEFKGSEIDGAKIIQFLRSKRVSRIYLSTGYADNDDVCRKARAMGIDDIIPKPVSVEKVKKLLSA